MRRSAAGAEAFFLVNSGVSPILKKRGYCRPGENRLDVRWTCNTPFYDDVGKVDLRLRGGSHCGPVAVALDNCCRSPVLACGDLPDPSSRGQAVRACPDRAVGSIPVMVCSMEGMVRFGVCEVCVHGMFSGSALNRGSPHSHGLLLMTVQGVFLPANSNVRPFQEGLPGKAFRLYPPCGLSRRFLAGVECCSSPGFWD